MFEEFLLFILSLRRMKESENRSENPFHFADRPEIEQFLGALPYHLTNAQEKVWTEIKSDMQSENVMSRLVQGDVGSGKTIIAFLALLLSALNGYQGALMAPTEVLAVQHYETYLKCWKNINPASSRTFDRVNDNESEKESLCPN